MLKYLDNALLETEPDINSDIVLKHDKQRITFRSDGKCSLLELSDTQED